MNTKHTFACPIATYHTTTPCQTRHHLLPLHCCQHLRRRRRRAPTGAVGPMSTRSSWWNFKLWLHLLHMTHRYSTEVETQWRSRHSGKWWESSLLVMTQVKSYHMSINFSLVWTVSKVCSWVHTPAAGTVARNEIALVGESPLLLSIPPLLHRQGAVHIFVGNGSIEKGQRICSKALTNDEDHITGRTMLRHAKDVLRNCKKMQALVTRRDSPYKDVNYIPSGTNWEDYIEWCLQAMYKAEQAGG